MTSFEPSQFYRGNPAATQAPSPKPGPGVAPVVSLPADGDANTTESLVQALKVCADYAFYASLNVRTIFVHPSFTNFKGDFFLANTVGAAVDLATLGRARIVILGPTTETQTPIVLPYDGIIVEAANDAALSAITWGTAMGPAPGPLFDLNGHYGCVFNNLSAQCLGAVSYDGESNALIVNRSGFAFPASVTVTNCAITGLHAEALIGSSTGSIINSVIRDNRRVTSSIFMIGGSSNVVTNNSFFWLDAGGGSRISGNDADAISSHGGCTITHNRCGSITTELTGNVVIGNFVTVNIAVADGASGKDNIVIANNVGGEITTSASGDPDHAAPLPTIVCANICAGEIFDAAPPAQATQTVNNTAP